MTPARKRCPPRSHTRTDTRRNVSARTRTQRADMGRYPHPSAYVGGNPAPQAASSRAACVPLRTFRHDAGGLSCAGLCCAKERGLCGHEYSRSHALAGGDTGRFRSLHGPQQSHHPLRPSGRCGRHELVFPTQSPSMGNEAERVQLHVIPHQRRSERLGQPPDPMVYRSRRGATPLAHLGASVVVQRRL